MKNTKRIFFILIAFIIILTIATNKVNAANNAEIFKMTEYTQEFKDWLNLSDEEKQKVLMPRMYEIPTKQIKNTLFKANMLRAGNEEKYTLKDYIPLNLKIKDQGNSDACWSFASISSLETNLAMSDYKNGRDVSKVYDFSEMHLEYATSKTFKDGNQNQSGYNRTVGDGGQWYMAESYLTNGTGAVLETDMPFNDKKEIIDISNIQNKTVSSQVYDTIDFPDYSGKSETEKTQIMNQIKQHIQNYGSVYASMHGNTLLSSDCYNNETGAKYCNNSILHSPDHSVSIVGWDDNYEITNFSADMKPQSKGAWIIRNSWGERVEESKSELKQKIFDQKKQECIDRGWTDSTLIPDSVIELNGYTIDGDKAYINIGDNGFMYVSYEDCNISKMMSGIVKAADKTDYDNIYQYDEYYPAGNLTISNQSNITLCNIFDKKTQGTEYLTQVSLYAPETYTCKVYVNPNGTSKDVKDLQKITLKEGESETFGPGYHTIEFAKPLKINASSFAVAIQIQGTESNKIKARIETKPQNIEVFDNVTIQNNKCFISVGDEFNSNKWQDLGTMSQNVSSLPNGDSTIKAFTVAQVEGDQTIKDIQVVTPPTKTVYTEGQNFDKTGMVVIANYNNDTFEILDDSSYEIIDGTSLTKDQNYVTIQYQGVTTTQSITVNGVGEAKEPKNSNFNNASTNIDKVKVYTYTNVDEIEYLTIDVTVQNIIKDNQNDRYEYYYYLSSSKDETAIQNWIKIKEDQTSEDKLIFEINSEDLTNYESLSEADELYLYIKEVAIKGDNQSEVISNAMQLLPNESTKLEFYLDDQKVSEVLLNTPQSSNSNNGTSQNNQTYPITKLPYAGLRNILIITAIVLIIGIILYIRYKKLSKYIK